MAKSGKKGKKIVGLLLLVSVVVGAGWYIREGMRNKYVVEKSYYTQVPTDTVNDKDMWIIPGEVKGREYHLTGYDKDGKSTLVFFAKHGKAEDYYAPGTYMRVDGNSVTYVGEAEVKKEDIPEKALKAIEEKGTKYQEGVTKHDIPCVLNR